MRHTARTGTSAAHTSGADAALTLTRALGVLLLVAGCAGSPPRPGPSGGRPASASDRAARAPAADDHARLADYFPDTPLVSQDGRALRFYTDLVRGKRVLINFMYTRCAET